MKFLLQKINKEVRHDFVFTLVESARFHNWLQNGARVDLKFFNTVTDVKGEIQPFEFKPVNKSCVPVGSVEFVEQYLKHFYGLPDPRPLNVPEVLFPYAMRKIFNGTEKDLRGKLFVKSNTKIKGICDIFDEEGPSKLPAGEYQFSEVISIDSEWRAFVYKGKLVGLQNYVGEFTLYPDVKVLKKMMDSYSPFAPIAYTLDLGVTDFHENLTFVIEVHDFFSCGLYGFADHSKLPFMFNSWFIEYVNKNK